MEKNRLPCRSVVTEKMKDMLKRIPEQIKRLAVVIAVIITGVVTVRYFILPSSLTDGRFHRQSTVERETAKNIVFAGATICGNCHGDKAEKKKAGYHKTVNCETCHGPAQSHIENPANKPAMSGEETSVSSVTLMISQDPPAFPRSIRFSTIRLRPV